MVIERVVFGVLPDLAVVSESVHSAASVDVMSLRLSPLSLHDPVTFHVCLPIDAGVISLVTSVVVRRGRTRIGLIGIDGVESGTAVLAAETVRMANV